MRVLCISVRRGTLHKQGETLCFAEKTLYCPPLVLRMWCRCTRPAVSEIRGGLLQLQLFVDCTGCQYGDLSANEVLRRFLEDLSRRTPPPTPDLYSPKKKVFLVHLALERCEKNMHVVGPRVGKNNRGDIL